MNWFQKQGSGHAGCLTGPTPGRGAIKNGGGRMCHLNLKRKTHAVALQLEEGNSPGGGRGSRGKEKGGGRAYLFRLLLVRRRRFIAATALGLKKIGRGRRLSLG